MPNSPAPLTDDWKVTDDSSVNFHDVFFFIFYQIIAKNEEKYIMEIYGWVVNNQVNSAFVETLSKQYL